MQALGVQQHGRVTTPRTAHEYLKLALSSSDIGHWRLDLATRVIRGSRNLAEMLGILAIPAHRRTKGFLNHLPRADRQALFNVALAAIERLGRFQHLLHVHPDAFTHRCLSIRGQCLADAQNRPKALVGVVIDVTSHITMEQAMRDNNASFHTLADSLQSCVVVIDGRRILYANRYLLKLLGYAFEELRPLPPFHIFAPECRPLLQRRNADRMRGLPAPSTYECQMLTRDGKRIWVEISPVCFEGYDHKAVLAVAIDISRRKRMEDRLRRVNATLGLRVAEHSAQARRRQQQYQRVSSRLTQAEVRERQRLAHVLHDNLQQLIFGAKMRMPLIRKGLNNQQTQVLEQAEDLLQQAIGAARNLSVELCPPILREGLGKAMRWLAQWMYDRHQLHVSVRTAGPVDLAGEDIKPLIFQAIREMLFNVVKHAHTARASVRLTHTSDAIHVVVRDKGHGFDPRELDVKPRSSFGLANMQDRVEILGGHVNIASQPNHGTTITLTVPLNDTSPPLAATATRKRKPVVVRKRRTASH